MNFGVAVLAGLGSGHVDDLTRPRLEHDEAVLAQRRALLGVGGGGARVAGLEVGVLDVCHCAAG